MGRNARKSERRGKRRRTGRDGDGRARKHLQRIGLTRVFNPARGFLVGEIKRGQVKRDARKIARATHTEQNRIAGIKGFSNMEDRARDRKRRRNEGEREETRSLRWNLISLMGAASATSEAASREFRRISGFLTDNLGGG